MRSTRILLGVVGLTLALAQPTRAELRFRNDTNMTINLAFAYVNDGDWISIGWYELDPGETMTALTGRLANRYYYWYAEGFWDDFEHRWYGEYEFSAPDEAFEINNSHVTRSPKLFRVVDVGNATDKTVSIPQPRVILNDRHSGYIDGDSDYFAELSFHVYDTGLLTALGHLRNSATFTGFRASFSVSLGPEDVGCMWRGDHYGCHPRYHFSESLGAGATDYDVYRRWNEWIPYGVVKSLDGTGTITIR